MSSMPGGSAESALVKCIACGGGACAGVGDLGGAIGRRGLSLGRTVVAECPEAGRRAAPDADRGAAGYACVWIEELAATRGVEQLGTCGCIAADPDGEWHRPCALDLRDRSLHRVGRRRCVGEPAQRRMRLLDEWMPPHLTRWYQ